LIRLSRVSSNVHRKSIQIKDILDIEISHSAIVRLQVYLNLKKNRTDKIETLERKIFNYAYVNNKFDIVILMAVSGIEEICVATRTAETYSSKDF
jgi:hypothetical protein